MDPRELLLVAAIGALAGSLLTRRLGIALDRLRRRRRWSRAKRGAAGADAVLAANASAVEDAEVAGGYTVHIDGSPRSVELRADRRVRWRGRTLVAEIKTGAKGVDPLHEPTRRQLLEYAVAFDTPELLLIDMEARQVRRVRFPLRRGRGRGAIFALGFAAGLAAGIAAARHPVASEFIGRIRELAAP